MSHAPSGPAENREPTLLETDVHLSQSIIWRLQRDFYAQRGLKAWNEDLVPSYITNNPFIAEIYAGIVAAFLQDCGSAAQLSPENPLRILELGGGTGKFSYLFLRKLTALLQSNNLPLHLVRYCMTDTAESLLAESRQNAYLQEFVSSGILELYHFGLTSRVTGEENSYVPLSRRNPA